MPVLTRNLLVLVVLLGLVYAGIRKSGAHHGDDHHGHHHHGGHQTITYEPVLGATAEEVLVIEVMHIGAGEMLRVSADGMAQYEGVVGCEGPADVAAMRLLRETTDLRVYGRWQTFFSRMTPDGHIDVSRNGNTLGASSLRNAEVAAVETYGLSEPVGCVRITVMRGSSTEALTLQFGDSTAQGLSQYMRIFGSSNIWLIPRYFWTEVVDVMGIG